MFAHPLSQSFYRPAQLFAGAEDVTELYEGAHNLETRVDGQRAFEDGGQHDGTVFGEGVGSVFEVFAAL